MRTIDKGWKKVTFYSDSDDYNPVQNNDNDAYVPEMWAAESIRTLVENMMYAEVVHRDFEDEIAQFGDIVHTREPGEFVAKRKQNDLDNLETQDATSRKVEVPLNQRFYVSFVIGDGEQSYSFADLIRIYLEPAVIAEARLIDQAVGSQVMQFLGNSAGGLGTINTTNGHDYLLDTRRIMNDNKVGLQNRWLGLASRTETIMQKIELFKAAQQVGDTGQALREALLGRKEGFNTFLNLNTPSVSGATTLTTTTTTAQANAGQNVVAVTSVANIASGQYVTIVGDASPLRVASIATLDLTMTRNLIGTAANGATVTPIATGLINQASAIAAGDKTAAVSDGYPANWLKGIVVDGTGQPKVGQLVSFKAAGGTVHPQEYCILQVDSLGGGDFRILLDKPLANTLANNDVVDYGPSGDYNFAFQRDALALVNRPLDSPRSGIGVRAGFAQMNDISLRVTMSYDGLSEGTRVTVAGLFGMAILNVNRGAVLLG